MRVLVTGATGNVGTSVVRALAADADVDEVIGVARRAPEDSGRIRYVEADVAADDLACQMRGVNAVVHLAWAIQPARDLAELHRVNVDGSVRVFGAAVAAGVDTIVHASSVGTYSPGEPGRTVDESWPTHGLGTSFYSRQKAYVERVLDAVEARNPGTRVVRLRPALIPKGEAANRLRQLFGGPLLPGSVLGRLPVAPAIDGLRLQLVHTDDVAEAYRLAVKADVRGAFNVAADPVLSGEDIAHALGARSITVPQGLTRTAAALAWRLRLSPTPEGWVDIALRLPLLDTTRARHELGWTPSTTATETLEEVLQALRSGRGGTTPPLRTSTSGPVRTAEVATGLGADDGVD